MTKEIITKETGDYIYIEKINNTINDISINELHFNIGKKSKTKKQSKKQSNIITNFSPFDWKMKNKNENIRFKF